MLLQCFGNLNRTGTVGIGLDHAYQFRFCTHLPTVIVEIVYNRIEIDFKNRLVNFFGELFGYAFKTKTTSTFEQHHFVLQCQPTFK